MLHVVAEVIEAELVVGRIGDVGSIGLAPLRLVEIGHDHAGGEPQKAIDLAHPFGVARGEIVVHRDDVHALALDRVEIAGERRHQRLALAGAHFGDLAAMEHDAADHLHVEMAHAKRADRGFADRGKGFGQDVVERLARFEPRAELERLVAQFLVGHGGYLRLEGVDLVDDLEQAFDVTVVGRAEKRFGNGAEHGGNSLENL